ncbi:MAG TPA: hemolysin family protein, partial [Chitinophagaceae bacterium]|nr:hemolysin family protein [Chitinophagaceae bacterium]
MSGILAMSEIAMVSSKKLKLKSESNRGDKKAKKALDLIHNPDRFFSTVQIGITLIGILLGIFSGKEITKAVAAFISKSDFLAPYSNSIASVVVVVLVTYFSLVLGELFPKRIAMSAPEKITKFMTGPIEFLSTIAFPFIWFLSQSSAFLVKIFGIQKVENVITEDEVKAMISEGTTLGTIDAGEQNIIERVFHLDDRSITSLMTHRSDIIWIDVNDSPEQYKRNILKELHSVYPVSDGRIDDIIGVIYTRDLYLHPEGTPLKQFMKQPLFIPENNTAFQVMEKFKFGKTSFGFIVDEYGDFLGMITMKDILEAIVGDMPEEDETDYEIIDRKDGSFLVDAQIPFYDFLSYFEKEDWINDEEQQEFDTLAGFILYHLEHIPYEGE